MPRTVAKFAPLYQHEAGGVTDEFRQLPDLGKPRQWPDVSGVLLRSYLDWVSSFFGRVRPLSGFGTKTHGPPSTPPRPHMALYFLQCSIERQNCDSSWPRATSQQTAFTNTSCVRDPRIPGGDVGRCGWQGAPCQVNGTVSNCASRKFILAIPPRPAPLIISIQPTPRSVAMAYAQGMFFTFLHNCPS
jgi:hypothetical protein